MTALSGVAPVLGADVVVGNRLWTDHGTWSSPITHFEPMPADYWATPVYGWDRVAYAGDIPIRPLAPTEMVAVAVGDPEVEEPELGEVVPLLTAEQRNAELAALSGPAARAVLASIASCDPMLVDLALSHRAYLDARDDTGGAR